MAISMLSITIERKKVVIKKNAQRRPVSSPNAKESVLNSPTEVKYTYKSDCP